MARYRRPSSSSPTANGTRGRRTESIESEECGYPTRGRSSKTGKTLRWMLQYVSHLSDLGWRTRSLTVSTVQLGVELGVTNRSGALWKTPTNGPSALISEVYLKPASYQLGAEQSALYTPSEPTHNVARRYATWQGAERRPRPQNHQPAQPLSQRPTPPQSSGGRPPLSQDLQKLILDIDNVRQNTRGLPVRAGLKMGEFAGHFDPDTGMLLASSPLRPFFGDPNLFPRKTWDWFVGG